VLVGINVNFGDTARLSDITLNGDVGVCDLFEGNDTGDEPEKVGEGPNGTSCVLS
jgi:pectate lyase